MIQPIYYMQTDSRWKNHNYSAPGEKKTIGSSGCGVACSAMVIATLKDKDITPVQTAEWSMDHGYKALNQGTYYSYFIPQFEEYGIECKRLNVSNLYGKSSSSYHTEALNALKNGDWIIACMGKGHWTSSGHFILVYGYENGYVYINDPASKASNRIKNTWNLFASQVKYLWTVTVHDSLKKKETTTEKGENKLMRGIDISKYQPVINLKDAKNAGYDFVILRIGYNKTKDPYFESHYNNAKAAGMKIGVYFYATSLTEDEAINDANRVLSWLGSKTLDMPIAYDMEESKMKLSTRKDLNSKQFNAFANTVRAKGFVPMLYTGSSMFNNYFNKNLINDPLWIANYGKNQGLNNGCPNVGKTIVIHQYTSAAIAEDFFKAKLDRNQMMISYEELMKKSSTTPVVKPSTSTTIPSTSYTKKQCVKDIQTLLGGLVVDGLCGAKTLAKLPLISKKHNPKHKIVKPLQRYLNALGYDCGIADGIAGTKFHNAVVKFQKANGLKADGILGQNSYKKLIGM